MRITTRNTIARMTHTTQHAMAQHVFVQQELFTIWMVIGSKGMPISVSFILLVIAISSWTINFWPLKKLFNAVKEILCAAFGTRDHIISDFSVDNV